MDCDTEVGTREGVPRLLEIFARRRLRAAFFFTLGPDRSGVAIRRAFTRRGFARKMVRSRGLSLYGWRTALSGTVLPARPIGRRCEGQMRQAAAEGHETGVHGWDHVAWHDDLPRMSSERVREAVERAHAEYARIFGVPARCSAAPGWTVSARSLEAQEERGLLFASDTRGGAPFYPSAGGRTFRTLEVPT
ncbi:MAG: polysaccharide deacetylase family protein, partial [Thermoanaerobaculia bacterium]